MNDITDIIDRYLQVPQDDCRDLMSPPCSPVPVDWHKWIEGPPMPWIEEFDLDAPEGLIHLGGDEYVEIATISKECRDKVEFKVIRRGVVIAKRLAGQSKRSCLNNNNNNNKNNGMSLDKAVKLPPIIIDSYE